MEKILMLGGIGGRRRRGLQKMRLVDGVTDSMDVSLSRNIVSRTPQSSERQQLEGWVLEFGWQMKAGLCFWELG